jgi:hypothetical protein
MRLRQSVFPVLLSAVLSSCSDKPVDCKRYKTGKFRFTANYNGKPIHFILERNDATQTEVCEELNAVANYKVNWKDDCSYQLVFLNGTDSLPEEAHNRRRKMVIQTAILSGTENYYLFEVSNNLDDRQTKDTMWVIK